MRMERGRGRLGLIVAGMGLPEDFDEPGISDFAVAGEEGNSVAPGGGDDHPVNGEDGYGLFVGGCLYPVHF